MGYLAYEAAGAARRTPCAAPRRCAVPSDRAPRDRPSGRSSTTGGSGSSWSRTSPPATTTAASRRWRSSPAGSRRPRRPRSRRCDSPETAGAGEANMSDEDVPRDRLLVPGAHPRRRHLPGRPVEAGLLRRRGRRVPDLPPPARLEPGALHVLPPDGRHGARRVRRPSRSSASRAGGSPPGRSPAPVPEGRPRYETGCSSTSSSRTRRSRPSTRCSSISRATTWVVCACPAASAPPS